MDQDLLHGFDVICAKLLPMWGAGATARWLDAHHPELGARPLDVLAAGQLDRVLAMLDAAGGEHSGSPQ